MRVACLLVALFVGTLATPAAAQKKKKKLSLAEVAALEWKLEQASKTLADNPAVDPRRKAIAELASVDDARAIKPLARALREDPDPSVRHKAADALAAAKTPEAKGLLTLTAASDPDPKVRAAAKAALGKLPKKMAPAALPLEARPFSGSGKDAKAIKAALALPSGDARLWAIRQLGEVKLGDRADLIQKHLHADPSSRVRVEAARLLARIGKRKRLPALIKALGEDGDPAVRFVLAQALAEFDDPGVLTVLQKLASDDTDASVRAEAKDLLEPSTAVGRRLLKVRIDKLRSQNPGERIHALAELSKFTDWRAMVPMSCALLADKSIHVRVSATKALANMHDASVLTALRVAAVVEPDAKQRATVRGQLEGLRKRADALLQKLQSATDPTQRVFAARALGQAGYAFALNALIAALKDKDARVRREVARALTKFDVPKAHDALRLAGSDTEPQVRQVVDTFFKDLARLKSWRAFYKDSNRLVMKTMDKDPMWRADAAVALGVAGAETTVAQVVQLLLTDKVEEVRLAAAWALVLMSSEASEKALRKAASKDSSEKVRLTARKYLVISKVSVDDLQQQLQSDKASVRVDAAEALSLRAQGSAVQHLIRAGACDADARVRSAALRGLARVGNELARSVLKLASVRDPDARVRRNALVMYFLAGGK